LYENFIEGFQKVTIDDEEDDNLEIKSSEEKNDEQNEELISDSNSLIEEEIKKLTLAEDKDLKKNFEIKEDLQSSVNTPSSESEEQE
jgi:uncharacterized membrane protein